MKVGKFLATHPRTLLIVVALTGMASCSTYVHNLHNKLYEAHLAAQRAALTKAGLTQGETVLYVDRVVPSLKPTVKVAHDAGVTTDAAAHIVYKTVQVEVPVACDNPTTVGDTPTTHQHALSLSADHDFYLGIDDGGRPWHTSKLFITVATNEPPSSQRVELSQDVTKSQVVLSDELEAAIKAHHRRPPRFTLAPRPWHEWRAGYVAGLGITTNATGSPSVGVFAGWGAQF